MDSAYQFMHAAQRSAGAWVEDLFQRSSHPLEEGKERRFVWPITLPQAHEELSNKAFLVPRITTAVFRSHVLFEEALRHYMSDFSNLYNKTAHVIAHNALLQHNPMNFDPSFVNAFTGMNRILKDMIGGATEESTAYFTEKSAQLFRAACSGDLSNVALFWEKQVEVLDIVVNQNPAAMKAIQSEMGCQFDDSDRYVKIAETPRAVLYQVLPLKEGVVVRENGKPIIHRSPFILPENIIDLLPRQGLSYVGAFANSGTPTYFMHVRNIAETEAVQLLSEEDLLFDLKFFAEKVHAIHGLKATINGTCQGALPLLHGICSSKLGLDRDVNAWIGTVPAYDLSWSKHAEANLRMVPESKRHLGTITHRLASGNEVVSGEPASLAARLNNPRKENPLASLIRDMRGAERGKWPPMAAALRHYLKTIKSMPIKITEMSQRCATTPITSEGVFPGLLFGEPVSLKYAVENGINIYVAAGEKDDVVDLSAALSMFEIPCIKQYSGARYHVIPGAGHVAPMTTCSVEGSKNFIGNKDGPLWHHLQLEKKEMQEVFA